MFKLFFTVLLSFLSVSTGFLTNMNELRRQYTDYLSIYNKEETSFGFETFVENLQRIESFNSEHSNCRMYLTQFSDTFEDNAIYQRCS